MTGITQKVPSGWAGVAPKLYALQEGQRAPQRLTPPPLGEHVPWRLQLSKVRKARPKLKPLCTLRGGSGEQASRSLSWFGLHLACSGTATASTPIHSQAGLGAHGDGRPMGLGVPGGGREQASGRPSLISGLASLVVAPPLPSCMAELATPPPLGALGSSREQASGI